MRLECLHLIKSNHVKLAYYYPTLTLNIIDDITYAVLNLLINNISMDQVIKELNLTLDEIQGIIQDLTEKMCNIRTHRLITKADECRIKRITLHISNDCNLRCKYCYAEGGNYNQERKLMSKQMAEDFVKFCMQNFTKIDQIVFFGGEPLLNIEAMEYVCKLFNDAFKTGEGTFLPNFGIITNGTIMNDRILNFINHNLSFITVSIDGTKELNNVNRVFKDGSGSYDKIAKFIRTIVKESNVKIRFEATFTQNHLDNGYKPDDVANYLSTEFGIKGTVVDELQIENKDIVDYWNELNYNELLKTNFTKLPVGFDDVLNTLVKKNIRDMCAVGKHTFAVGADGEIYPCHMNNGEKENSLGNICGRNIFNDTQSFQKQSSHLALKNNSKCIKCWANGICGGCAMKWFYDKQKKQYGEYPNPDLCEWVQNHLEKILLMIGYIRKKPELWSAFLKRKQMGTHESNN